MSADVRIGKHRIAVTASTERLAVRCRQFLTDKAQHELPQLYERIFNHQEDGEHHFLNIGKLRINLGEMTEKEMETNFINALELQIRSVLEQLLEQSPGADDRANVHDRNTTADNERRTLISYRSESQQNVESLCYFIEKGHYPWWLKKDQKSSPMVRFVQLSHAERADLLFFLIRNFEHWSDANRNAAVKRLVSIVDEASVVKTIGQLTKLFANGALEQNISQLLENGPRFCKIFALKLQVIHEVIFYTILSSGNHDRILTRFVERLFQTYKVADHQALKAFTTDQYRLFSDSKILDNLVDTASVFKPEKKKDISPKNATKNIDKQEIYINNAGIIILHPFLAPFFNVLGLTNELNQFTTAEGQTLAAILLHYLQTGNPAYEEWEMTLNKVLCGLDPAAAIDNDICIPEQAMLESGLLLQELIDHWTALKGSGIESVQNSFFSRAGKLSYNGSAWLLQVERTAMDVLVDRLPWGFSVVRLPWNKQLIYTEW